MTLLRLGLIATAISTLVACGGESQSDASSTVVEAGQQVWQKNCAVCHKQGLGGAPPIGNQKMWKKRIAQGLPTLVEHAKNGYSGETGEMPPRGGNPNLTDSEVESAVKYMVKLSS